jgi:PAS domain S-box-containing protein
MYQYRFCSKLIEILHEGIWLIDHNGLTTFVNPQMTKLLGYTAQEMPGRHFLSFVDGDSTETATRFLERSKRGVQERYDIELRRKDGTRLTASLESSPITDAGGNYVGVIAAVQDITERKRTEEALRSSEGRFRDLTESTADMIWEIDADSVYT